MATGTQDAITLLKADHRKVEDLFEEFEDAADKRKKKALAEQICIELSIHATIEEEIFYPACTGKIEEDTVEEAYVEHDGAKVLIAEIMGAPPGSDPFFDAKVTVLSELIKHHVKEEEGRGGMFAQAKKAELDLQDLGVRLLTRKEELMAKIKEAGLPAPITRTYKSHDIEAGEPVKAVA